MRLDGRRVAAIAPIALALLAGCQGSVEPTSTEVESAITATSAATSPATTTAATVNTTASTTAPTTASTTTSTTASSTTSTSTSTTSTTTSTTTTTTTPDRGSIRDIRPRSDLPAPRLPTDWTTEVVGTSVDDRDIVAWRRPVDSPRQTVLVIGGLHGNEPVSPPVVRGLVAATRPDDVEVWLIPEANPDGIAAGTRWNANGVDLNRNFSWDWRASDGGPGPLSEPESDALAALIDEIRPDVVVWVHQPYGYVSSVWGTDRRFEQAWSEGSGLPTRSGVTQHGGGESWTHFVAGLPSMLIEVDSWEATAEMVAAQRAGFEALLATL